MSVNIRADELTTEMLFNSSLHARVMLILHKYEGKITYWAVTAGHTSLVGVSNDNLVAAQAVEEVTEFLHSIN